MIKKEHLKQIVLEQLNSENPREGLDGVCVKDVQKMLLSKTGIKFSEPMIISVLKEFTDINDGEGYDTADGTFVFGDDYGGDVRHRGIHKYWFFFT